MTEDEKLIIDLLSEEVTRLRTAILHGIRSGNVADITAYLDKTMQESITKLETILKEDSNESA
jgi:hypothetical protein